MLWNNQSGANSKKMCKNILNRQCFRLLIRSPDTMVKAGVSINLFSSVAFMLYISNLGHHFKYFCNIQPDTFGIVGMSATI